MIPGHNDERSLTLEQRGQGIEKPSEGSIEPEQLIVQLPGVGTEFVADVIGGGEGNREHIGASPAPQLQAPSAFQRDIERERVHPRKAERLTHSLIGIVRDPVGEGDVAAPLSNGSESGSAYAESGRRSVQLRPPAPQPPRARSTREPRGQRVRVVPAGDESARGIPEHGTRLDPIGRIAPRSLPEMERKRESGSSARSQSTRVLPRKRRGEAPFPPFTPTSGESPSGPEIIARDPVVGRIPTG